MLPYQFLRELGHIVDLLDILLCKKTLAHVMT